MRAARKVLLFVSRVRCIKPIRLNSGEWSSNRNKYPELPSGLILFSPLLIVSHIWRAQKQCVEDFSVYLHEAPDVPCTSFMHGSHHRKTFRCYRKNDIYWFHMFTLLLVRLATPPSAIHVGDLGRSRLEPRLKERAVRRKVKYGASWLSCYYRTIGTSSQTV
jgi:hypothetical protein